MALGAFFEQVVGQPPSHERKHHYKFGKTLGAGAFGVVREARNRDTNEDVAIKVILKSKLKTPQQAKSVLGEFEILSQLNHPHIVQLREWFESKEKMYMVTQLCTGGELFDRIIDNGSFTEKDASNVVRQIAHAVKYLHDRNIVHRDIKPENLLYEHKSKENAAPLVLCDFGVAKSLLSSKDLITSAAGSLGYAAPEVFCSEGHSKPADVWSLGVVLYTLLSGLSPFQSETAEQFMEEVRPGYKPYFFPKYWDHVSEGARSLVTRMLEYDQHKRITIDEVVRDPWVSQGDLNEDVDLLPTVRPQLESRKRWRAAFEKLILAKKLNTLDIADESDDEESAESVSAPGARFMQVVAAAKAQSEAEKKAHEKDATA